MIKHAIRTAVLVCYKGHGYIEIFESPLSCKYVGVTHLLLRQGLNSLKLYEVLINSYFLLTEHTGAVTCSSLINIVVVGYHLHKVRVCASRKVKVLGKFSPS